MKGSRTGKGINGLFRHLDDGIINIFLIGSLQYKGHIFRSQLQGFNDPVGLHSGAGLKHKGADSCILHHLDGSPGNLYSSFGNIAG
ncbi:hypothetical protein D3C81_2119510 [compost metagenome]